MADIIQPEPPFTLTPGERESPVFKKLYAHVEKRCNELRRQNDVLRPEQETAFIRGQISFCKEILKLAKDSPPIGDQP